MACTSDRPSIYVKQHPGDAQLSLDELRDMVGRGTDLLQSCVHSIREYQNFPNSYLLFTKVSMHLSISHSLCSAVHNYDSLCRRSSRSPIMLSILLVIGASVSEAPSCGLDGRAVMHDIYIYIRPAPDTAHARRYAQT